MYLGVITEYLSYFNSSEAGSARSWTIENVMTGSSGSVSCRRGSVGWHGLALRNPMCYKSVIGLRDISYMQYRVNLEALCDLVH